MRERLPYPVNSKDNILRIKKSKIHITYLKSARYCTAVRHLSSFAVSVSLSMCTHVVVVNYDVMDIYRGKCALVTVN